MNCPLCGATGAVRFVKRGFSIARCSHCRHLYAIHDLRKIDVARLYDDTYFAGETGEYGDYEAEHAELYRRGEWYGKLLRDKRAFGNLLDIGAASGHILEGLVSRGGTGAGLEPNLSMVQRARARGLTMYQTTLEEFDGRATFDAIVFVQVLMHFYDLGGALKRARSLTQRAGLWLIETWDRESLVARLFGPRWHAFNPPTVLHWFSKDSLRSLIEGYGFRYLAAGRPPRSIAGARAKSLLRRDRDTTGGRTMSEYIFVNRGDSVAKTSSVIRRITRSG